MKRRDFIKTSASAGAILGALGRPTLATAQSSCSPAPFPQAPGLTKYVADFIVSTKYSDMPADVVELGKKSILDSLGLALSGSKARTSDLLATYVKPFEVAKDGATVIATSVKLPVRFAALANGVAIHVAEGGVVATDFAGIGWTGAEQILEAQRGFFHAYGGGYDPNAILNKLGKPWTFALPGVSIKPCPSGSLTHPGMTEMLRLIRSEHIRAARVEQVEVGTNRNMPNALIHHQPQDGLQAKDRKSV